MAILIAATDNTPFSGGMQFYDGTPRARDAAYTGSEAELPLLSNGTGAQAVLSFAESQTIWFHARCWFPTGANEGSADGEFLQFWGPNGEIASIDVVNGSFRAVVDGGSTGALWPVTILTPITLDIMMVCDGVNRSLTIYVNGVDVSSSTRGTTFDGIEEIRFINNDMLGVGSAGSMFMTEIIVDDADNTTGCRLGQMQLDGDGNYAEWTGGYLDLQEKNDGNYIQSDTAGERYSGTLEAYPGPNTGEAIRAILAEIEVYPGSIGPGGITQFLRIGGTDYYGTVQSFADTRHQKAADVFVQNPDTLLPWSVLDLATLEIGVRSET